MIKHIVMWKLQDEVEGATRGQNALAIKHQLEGLPAVIPQIRELEVGLNRQASDRSMDVILITGFDSLADLATYRDHPRHRDVAAFIREVVSDPGRRLRGLNSRGLHRQQVTEFAPEIR